MKIVLNRIDDRLIHGQVLVSWIKKLNVRQVLVVDDRMAGEQLAETVLAMTLPVNTRLTILSTAEGGRYLREENDGTQPNTILLMKSPEVLKHLWDQGYRPAALNIGGMAAGPARRLVCRGFYASEKEIALFREFSQGGTEIDVQVVLGENKINVCDLL